MVIRGISGSPRFGKQRFKKGEVRKPALNPHHDPLEIKQSHRAPSGWAVRWLAPFFLLLPGCVTVKVFPEIPKPACKVEAPLPPADKAIESKPSPDSGSHQPEPILHGLEYDYRLYQPRPILWDEPEDKKAGKVPSVSPHAGKARKRK
jgi:hypothetical protein